MLVAQAEAGEGTLLGWHHLVHRQVEQKKLVRPVEDALVFHDRHHYLITHRNAKSRPEYVQFRQWLDEEIATMMQGWPSRPNRRPFSERRMKPATEKPKGYRRLIPSVTALVEFEAVARLGSFTLAAHELGVTQAAVSRQVRFLEETLGTRLFRRLHRAIELTGEGEALYRVVAESMQKIASVFDRIARGPVQQELVLAATSAFSHFRLLPRLASLKAVQPDLAIAAVRLRCSRRICGTRRSMSPCALATACGRTARRRCCSTKRCFRSVRLHGWKRRPRPRRWKSSPVPRWSNRIRHPKAGWAGRSGSIAVGFAADAANFSLRCSLYTDAIQAARYGQGVALGWGRLVRISRSGRARQAAGCVVKAADAYFVVVPHGRALTSAIAGVIGWLREGAGES